jgi:hypothetical protein
MIIQHIRLQASNSGVTSHAKSTKRSLRNYMSLSTPSAKGAVISTSLPAHAAHVSSNWPSRFKFGFGAGVNVNPRKIEGNESYILGEIGFNNPGYQQVVLPFNMFHQSLQQFVLLPGIQRQHSIFYGSPHQCSAGFPQATDSSRMPLEAREQYSAFSGNRSYIHSSVIYRSSFCQALYSLLHRSRPGPSDDEP